MARAQTIVGTIVGVLIAATPVGATLDEMPVEIYRGLCQMTETCTADGGCGTTPALGDLLLIIDGRGTQLGRDDADLSPIEHFATLSDGLTPSEFPDFRRTFLIDLEADATARRFAIHVQTPHPDTGAPVLRPQYFVLSCEAL